MLVKLIPEVYLTKILQAAIAQISICQTNYKHKL